MSDRSSLLHEPEHAPLVSVQDAQNLQLPRLKTPSRDVEDATIVHILAKDHDIFDGEDAAIDPVYQAKARVLNAAFQEIRMGKYQVRPQASELSPPASRGAAREHCAR